MPHLRGSARWSGRHDLQNRFQPLNPLLNRL
jgi:hypothetical protein